MSKMKYLIWILVLFSLIVVGASTPNTHYVLPDDTSPLICPGEPCLTFDQYARAAIFPTESTFIFLAGNHTPHTTVHLVNISDVTFVGEVSDTDANIFCKNRFTIICSNTTNLSIRNLTFLFSDSIPLYSGISIVLRVFNSKLILISHVAFNGSADRNAVATLGATNSTVVIASCVIDSYSLGALYALNNSNIVITGTTFTRNIAEESGGAIFADHSTVILNGTLINKFTHNSASLSGGAIFSNVSFINMSGLNIFDSNYGVWGTVVVHDGEIAISGTAWFTNNRAKYGGGLYLSNSTASLGGQEIIFRNNIASVGGAICANRRSHVITNTVLLHCVNNTAGVSGGAIFINISVLTLGSNLNHYHNFSGNSGRHYGGAIACQLCNITIHGTSNFTNNHVLEYGGALFINTGNITLSGKAIFRDNWAKSQGGACYLENSYALFAGQRTQFIANAAQSGGAILSYFSSLLVLHVESFEFDGNTALGNGGAVNIAGNARNRIALTGVYYRNEGKLGGAIYVIGIKNATIYNITIKNNSQNVLCIAEASVEITEQVMIANNSGKLWGGVYLLNSFVSFAGNYTLIANNSGGQGGGLYSLNSVVTFRGITDFMNNRAATGGAINALYSTVTIQGSTHFTHNTANSSGGAIYASGSDIYIRGRVYFYSNSARKGGAMFYETSATLNLYNSVDFSHNHASEYGGAIYNEDVANLLQCTYKSPQGFRINNDVVDRLPYCFMQVEGVQVLSKYNSTVNITLTSNSDSAQRGNFLYGGLLDRCKMYVHRGKIAFVPNILFMPNNVLIHIKNESNWSTAEHITSQPYRLCFCINDRECTQTISRNVYRGQRFSVDLLARDQNNNFNSPQVFARTSPTARLRLNQSIQTLNDHCTQLTYNVYSTQGSEELILSTEGPCRDTGLGRAIVSVMLEQCPEGFEESNELCVCEERLKEYNVTCSIDEEATITRNAGSKIWMAGLYENNAYKGLIICNRCPIEYCTSETVNVSLDDPDIQCASNRGKLLCGACGNTSGPRLSLMLGGSQCGECSNAYLALILPFAAAGIVLVVVLSTLRLTVANGMINGVILYANVLQANRKMFFPTDKANVLTVFLAWVNLDLGFKTCFYDGMTSYAQTWLQFVFPVYVWILISLIILTSRYSFTVSKLIGNNPVAVLATLLLMSYTKILKIGIDVYGYAYLKYPDNFKVDPVQVWLKDANVPYFQSWHLLLAVVTSLVLLFLFLPYTFLLLLGYKLYRFSGRQRFRWLNRLKPFLDTYYAPYKKHTRYWTGFLLLVRCTLYIIFGFNSLKMTCTALTLVLAAIVTKAWLFGRIYENLCLDIIESSIYLNLIVLSALSIAGTCPIELTYLLIGIVFITMIGIVLFQFLFLYTGSLFSRLGTAYHKILRLKTQAVQVPPIAGTVSFIDLREALLESSNH
jgi:predicted outer membrane repeat protein